MFQNACLKIIDFVIYTYDSLKNENSIRNY